MIKTLIIHNPEAGKGRHNLLLNPFRKENIPIVKTNGPGDATRIVEERIEEFELFIAAGGDGTVNEISKAIIGTRKKLGILPMGSGNGLVNEVGSISAESIINNDFKESCIDTLELNNLPFVNLAGIGFEASVAQRFSQRKSRGFHTYIGVTLSQFFKFRPLAVDYECDGDHISQEVFSLTIANSRQYGNNAVISPDSKMDDGVFEVCAIRKFPFLYGSILSYRLFNGSISESVYYKSKKCKLFELLNDTEQLWNLDGEPIRIKGPATISIKPSSLKILCSPD